MSRRLASIPLDKIDVPKDALRKADHAWVATLAVMMAEAGQAQPIEIAASGSRFDLVFGLHRLQAARQIGWKAIEALIDEEGGDRNARRRRAIHENLIRRELSVLDRALHITELHGLEKADRGELRGGKRVKAGEQKSDDRTFDLLEEVAEKVGLSRSTVAEARQIATGIGITIRRRLDIEPLQWLADSRADLLRLAREPDARQTRILDLIASEASAASTVGEAIDVLDGRRIPSESERHWALAENAYARLQGKHRDRFFEAHEADFTDWQQRRKGRR
jgi:ParB family chromosome partitioning protein